jgi:hypothetical protein
MRDTAVFGATADVWAKTAKHNVPASMSVEHVDWLSTRLRGIMPLIAGNQAAVG